jgi:serine/threonine protein phosphatase PrpC
MRVASVTDIGAKKKTNQDGYCLKVAETPAGSVAFGIVCDGVGGLASGELASAHVVNVFSRWFDEEFPSIIWPVSAHAVMTRWEAMLSECNSRIMAYGEKSNAKMGTTASAILIQSNGDYALAHVGDSRIYEIGDGVKLLTKDHTVVAEAMDAGRLTPEQARSDARKHVLTRCVGTAQVLKPDIRRGKVAEDSLILICSDGLYNHIEDRELAMLSPQLQDASSETMRRALDDLVEKSKARGEKDNITALLMGLSS